MDKILKDSLFLLGLSNKELQFYEACFLLGPSTIPEIAAKAKLERSTAYLLATELLEKKFINEDFSQYKKRFTTISPRKIQVLLAAKQRFLQKQELLLNDVLPELDAIYQKQEQQPQIKFYKGTQGVRSVWRDVLSTKNEILLWTNQAHENKFFSQEFHDRFIEERINKQIPIRALAVNNLLGKKLLEKDEASLRHSKLLPIHTSFSAETYLYDNKIATLDYNGDIIAIIIESRAISSTQKAIFEMMWESL